MGNHIPKHQSEMVVSGQWKSFFAEVAELCIGRPVRVTRGEDLADGEAEPGTLAAISFKHKLRKNDVIITVDTASGSQSETIRLNLVWAMREPDGAIQTLELIDEHDYKLLLEFQSPH